MFLESVDIGDHLVVAYFERWIITLGHFSEVFSEIVHGRPINISYHIFDLDNVSFEGF